MTSERLPGWVPIVPEVAGRTDGAQVVNGQWYAPAWGCDSLQHMIDDSDPAALPPDVREALRNLIDVIDLDRHETNMRRMRKDAALVRKHFGLTEPA